MQRSTVAVVLAALAVSAAAVAPVSAAAATNNTTSNPVDDWLTQVDDSNQDEQGLFEKVVAMAPDSAVAGFAAVDGQLSRQYHRFVQNPFDDPPTNEEQASKFAETVNENNETLERGINQRTNLTTSFDTNALIVGHEESDPVAVYVLGDVQNNNVTNLRVVNETEFNATGREVDEIWVADGQAAQNLPDVADSVIERTGSGESLGTSYQANLGGRYCSVGAPWGGSSVSPENCEIRSTIWLDNESVVKGADE